MAGRIPVQLCLHLFLGLWRATTHRWAPLPGFEFHWTPLFPSTPLGFPLAGSAAGLVRLLLPGLAAAPGLKSPPGFSLVFILAATSKKSTWGPKPKAWPQVPDLTSLGCVLSGLSPQRGLGGIAGPLSLASMERVVGTSTDSSPVPGAGRKQGLLQMGQAARVESQLQHFLAGRPWANGPNSECQTSLC